MLELYFGSSNYLGPKCRLKEKGSSAVEGEIASGKFGYMKSITDVPNKGQGTPGLACTFYPYGLVKQASFLYNASGLICGDHVGCFCGCRI